MSGRSLFERGSSASYRTISFQLSKSAICEVMPEIRHDERSEHLDADHMDNGCDEPDIKSIDERPAPANCAIPILLAARPNSKENNNRREGDACVAHDFGRQILTLYIDFIIPKD